VEECLIAYGLRIKTNAWSKQDEQEIDFLYEIISSVLLAAKYIKDIHQNIENVRFHDQDWISEKYQQLKHLFDQFLYEFTENIQQISFKKDISPAFVLLDTWDQELFAEFAKDERDHSFHELDLSTIVHIHRAFVLAAQSLMDVLKQVDLTFSRNQL
jgi:hypothetical protein